MATYTLDDTIIYLAGGYKHRPPKKPAQLLDWLWLGDQNAAFNGLASGYTHIISCVNQYEMDTIYEFWNMHEYKPHHLHILVEDNPTTQITQYYPQIAKWILQYNLTNSQKYGDSHDTTIKILIHCQAGINRSSSLAIMIYCDAINCSPSTAAKFIWPLRPGILTNRAFRQQIDKWYSTSHNPSSTPSSNTSSNSSSNPNSNPSSTPSSNPSSNPSSSSSSNSSSNSSSTPSSNSSSNHSSTPSSNPNLQGVTSTSIITLV